MERLIALAQPVKYRPISRFPATSQDLAVVVGLDMPTDRVVAAIRKYAGADLESIELFDVYEGPQVGAGKRSLAYRLSFRSASRTLSDADVNNVVPVLDAMARHRLVVLPCAAVMLACGWTMLRAALRVIASTMPCDWRPPRGPVLPKRMSETGLVVSALVAGLASSVRALSFS